MPEALWGVPVYHHGVPQFFIRQLLAHAATAQTPRLLKTLHRLDDVRLEVRGADRSTVQRMMLLVTTSKALLLVAMHLFLIASCYYEWGIEWY